MPAKPEKPAATPALATDRVTARALGKALWDHDFRKDNPEAAPEQRREAWTAARTDYLRAGRQMHRRLAKEGFVITPPQMLAAE